MEESLFNLKVGILNVSEIITDIMQKKMEKKSIGVELFLLREVIWELEELVKDVESFL